ncbi:MAG: redox-regulated ATPase YchF [candidate division WOR-3 bacterium]
MALQIGIVGLPNVGKSTLFNALTKQQVDAANYPFCTIDPNVGVIAVPDERLEKLAKLENSAKIIPAIIEFVDIAGLVKNAHQGQGLGNQFLSYIRSVDAIAQVVRFFPGDTIHIEGSVNPIRDIEIVNTELILADLEVVKKIKESAQKDAKSNDPKAKLRLEALEKIFKNLAKGIMASKIELTEQEKKTIKDLQLLTFKPMIYIANTTYDIHKTPFSLNGYDFLPVDARVESELALFSDKEKKEYFKSIGLTQGALDLIIKKSYEILNLITFFTVGPKETHAWTCRAGAKAPQAAGIIHSDFERGFIRAEVIQCNKLLAAGSFARARELGWLRLEGKDYIIEDGDVVYFRFSV